MPRNITVTLADGTQHVYANAPDNVTPDMVTARAQKDFGQAVTALDGGRKPSAPTPAPTPAGPPSVKNGFGLGAPPGPKGTPERAAYDAEYNKRFNAAYLAANPSRTQRIASGAQARADQGAANTGNFLTALKAGVTRGLFGIPERIAAAGEAYLPSAITGNTSHASYNDILDTIRANTDAELGKSTAGNITGQVIGGLGAGRAAAGALGALASRAEAASAPIVARAGNYLQNLLTLKKGQTVANAGKVIVGGASGGAAQAAGEGSDPVKGAEYGAGGAAVLGGGFKAAQVLTRPFRDFLRLSSAGSILNRLTSSTTEQLSAKADAYRAATGAEPTLFELLPLADRNKILKQAVVGRDNVVESASNAIRSRAANLGPEMADRARAVLQPRRDQITDQMVNDLTAARGGTPEATDPSLAMRAANSPTDMLDLRDQEARAIMAPHETTPVAESFSEILPQHPEAQTVGKGKNKKTVMVMVDDDPAATSAIRSAAPAGFRIADQGVTAGDISDMIQTLRGDLGKGGIEGRTAQRAIDHLESELTARAPDAAAAHSQMTDAYSARSRMAEGMQEGAATRLRDDVQVGTSRSRARTVRNAYDSPEGVAGRALGQGNRILSDLGGSPEEALRSTVGISRNSTGRQLAQNIGVDEAAKIAAAARAQDQSAQALASASQTAKSSGGEAANAETLVQALAGLHPSSFVTTKAGAVRKLLDMTYIPESRAKTMVDMIFSQNPDIAARALRAVGNEPNGGQFLKYLGGVAGVLSANGDGTPDDQSAGGVVPPAAAAEPPQPEPAAVPQNEPQAAPAPGDDPNVPFGHAVIASIFPDAQITSDVRSPDDPLSEENPGSYHTKSQNAVDVRPIPGMSFADFLRKIHDEGYSIIEARDEVRNPSRYATGPHWHVVIAG